jgi:hypothetical protein
MIVYKGFRMIFKAEYCKVGKALIRKATDGGHYLKTK